jgi:hypothetical protein
MSEQDELKEFQEHCDGWIHKLGLMDWDWRCSLNDDNDNANVLLNQEGRKAYIGLCRQREACCTIAQLAKHECLEILLADLALLAQPYVNKDIIDDEVHKVINRLMIALV